VLDIFYTGEGSENEDFNGATFTIPREGNGILIEVRIVVYGIFVQKIAYPHN